MEESAELLLPLVQEENICLPLPINAVAKYWNVTLPLAEAAEAAKAYPGFGGSVLIEGIESAERGGLSCKVATGSLPKLKAAISAGVPPIVILPGIPEITQHASVITGYDDKEGTILHYVQEGNREGEQQEGVIPQGIFDSEWAEEGRTMILIGPADVISPLQLGSGDGERANRLCLESERQMILGDVAGAGSSLGEAIKLDPGNAHAHYLLASMQSAAGRPECVKTYTRCLELNARSYLAHNGLGNHLLKSGQLEKAKDHYTRAIAINPKRSAKIYKNRAYLLDKLGDKAGAKADLGRYVTLYPKAPDRGVIEQAMREL